MGGTEQPKRLLKYLLVAIIGGLIGAASMAWIASQGAFGPPQGRFPYLEAGRPNAEHTAFTEAIRRTAPAVVSIETRFVASPAAAQNSAPIGGRGSGIIVDGKKGYILTNAHVIQGARSVKVRLADLREFNGVVIGQDQLSDIALLRINGRNLPTARLGHSANLPLGAWVVAIGNPLFFDRSVTAGIISGKGRYIRSPKGDFDLPDLLQTDAAINVGNSGGALVNLRGEVVGVPTAVVRSGQAEGLGFAVPIDQAKLVIRELLKYGRVRHPWVGVIYSSIALDGPGGNLPPDGKGVVILGVAQGSPADRAGLRKGDVVRRAGSKEILIREDLHEIVRGRKVGEHLPLLVWRAGREIDTEVIIGEAPAADKMQQLFPEISR